MTGEKQRNHSSQNKSWWEFIIRPPVPNDIEFDLIEWGALGTCIDENGSIHCYLEGSPERTREFIDSVHARGIKTDSLIRLESESWFNKCEELWKPLTIGELSIVPVLSDDSSMQRTQGASNQVFLTPGLGFGTGHHATTKNLIGMLQNKRLIHSAPNTILDLGTGSGLLAIVAAKIFPGARIRAIDIDADALENARHNLTLNGLEQRVTLENATLNTLDGSFDLLVANLYAELLIELAPRIVDKLPCGGVLLISGIVNNQGNAVLEQFSSLERLLLEERIQDDGWVSLAFSVTA